MRRKIWFVLAIGGAFALGIWLARCWYQSRQSTTSEDATVLLERMQQVAKLITVEGYFSEIYDYKDYWHYDILPLRKKALLRVKAKVSVGYDLSRLEFEARPEERLIVLSNLPDPEILSIDHDIDYYDIQEGIFNSFSREDYNRLNAEAKELIRKRALESHLFLVAEEQSNQLQEMMRFMAESAGWTLRFQPRTPTLQPLD
ncbi:MAG: DUF4230 domain-containing protein [Bacteroidetes bacterium]|nr:MAG: DUF4230 domain-containing protein [Bacteroidota bacterium]